MKSQEIEKEEKEKEKGEAKANSKEIENNEERREKGKDGKGKTDRRMEIMDANSEEIMSEICQFVLGGGVRRG